MGHRAATAGLSAKGALAVALGLMPICGITANVDNFNIFVGIGASDNISEVASPKTSEIIPTAGIDVGILQEGSVLGTDVKGTLAYMDYARGTFPNQVLGRLDGTVKLTMVPQTVTWTVQDSFGQGELAFLEPANPGNLQNINVFSTGPDVSLNIGKTGFVRLGARYEDVHYETSPFDSHRPVESLALGELLSASSSVSLNADAEQVRFVDTSQSAIVGGIAIPPNADYDRREAYLRYQVRGARTGLALNLGTNQVSQPSGWYSSPLAQLSLARRLTPFTTLVLSAGQQITDAGEGFRDLQAGVLSGIVIAPVAGTSASYVARYGSAALSFERNRTLLALSERFENDSYQQQNSNLNVKSNDFELNVGRQLSGAVGVQLFGAMTTYNYRGQNFESNDHQAGAALSVRPTSKIDVTLRYDHVWRSASGPGSITFNENRAFLFLTYRPLRAVGSGEVGPMGLLGPMGLAAPMGPMAPMGPTGAMDIPTGRGPQSP